MRWAGHVRRKGEERQPKRAWELDDESRRRMGRRRYRWEDSVNGGTLQHGRNCGGRQISYECNSVPTLIGTKG